MSVKIEINGSLVEFASMAEAQKAYSAAQAAVELLPAVNELTNNNEALSKWIVDNRIALVGLTKVDTTTAKKELAEHIKASGNAWLIANIDRISISVVKPTATELAAKITAGVTKLAAGNAELAAFVVANYEDIREAVKPKLNEAAVSGRDKYLADVAAAKEISVAHGNACRKKYADYKAAEEAGTLEAFVANF
jgi:hypothetical protein